MMKFWLGLMASSLLLVGCNGIELNSNLGSYATQTGKSYTVDEYSKDDILRYDADALGLVEASGCQAKPGDVKPTRPLLVKALKIKTRDKGGNGLVVEQCATEPQPNCSQYLMCWGMAYEVPWKQARP